MEIQMVCKDERHDKFYKVAVATSEAISEVWAYWGSNKGGAVSDQCKYSGPSAAAAKAVAEELVNAKLRAHGPKDARYSYSIAAVAL